MAEEKALSWDNVEWDEAPAQQPAATGLEAIEWEPTPIAPIEFSNDNLETNDQGMSPWDYARLLPGLGIAGTGKWVEDKIDVAEKAEKFRDHARTMLATGIAYHPGLGDRGKRILEDLITEGTRTISAPIEMAGTLLEDIGIQNDIDEFGKGIAEMGMNPLDVYREQGYEFGEEDWGDLLSQGIASTLGFVASGATAKAMGLGKAAISGVVATLGAAVGGQGGRLEAEAFDASPEHVKAAYYFNSLFGLTEAVPIMKAFDRLDDATGGMLTKHIKSKVAKIGMAGFKGALEEALQETFQSVGGNITAAGTYDPGRDWYEQIDEAASVGGSVGFLMNALAASLGVRLRRGRTGELKESLGEEALRLTGAEKLEDIAFGREGHEGEKPGVVQITTLSDEYLRVQKEMAGINEDIARYAEEFGEPTDDQLISDKSLQYGGDARQGPDISHGETVPDFFEFMHPNSKVMVNGRESYDLRDAFEQKDLVTALTHNRSRESMMLEDTRMELDEAKDRLDFLQNKENKAPSDLGVIRRTREDIEHLSLKEKQIKAKIALSNKIADSFERMTKKALKMFPEGTKILVHDYDTLVNRIDGEPVIGSNYLGMADVYSYVNPEGQQKRILAIYIRPDDLLASEAALTRYKNLGADGEGMIGAATRNNTWRRKKLYNTFWHELGHIYSYAYWGNLGRKVRIGEATQEERNWWTALQRDYTQFVNEGMNGSLRKTLFNLFSYGRARQELASIMDINPAHVDGMERNPFVRAVEESPMLEQFTAERLKYLLSFEEYMAEEMAKAATMGKVPGTRAVDPFFRRLVKEMRKLQSLRPTEHRLTSRAFGQHLRMLSLRGQIAEAIDKMKEPLQKSMNPLQAFIGKDELMRPEVAVERMEEVDKFNWFMDVGFNLLQIAEQNPHIDGLQEYVKLMREWKNEVNGNLAVAQETIKDWERLGKKEQELLGRILLDETVGLTFDGKTLKTPRNFTEAEIAQYGLSEEGLAVRQKVKEDLRGALDEMEKVLKARVMQMFIEDPTRQVAELRKISQEFQALRSRPYFPLMRFGEYTMTVRAGGPITVDGKTYKEGQIIDYQAFDTEREQKKAASQERARGRGTVVAEGYMKQPNFSIQGMPLTMIEHLERALGNTMTSEQKEMFDLVKKDVLPFKSFRKQFVRRKRVAGYSMDAIRSYANYMTSFSNHIGRVKFDSKFQDAIKSVADSATVMDKLGKKSVKRTQIHNYMLDHLEYVLNPVNEFTAIRSAAFFWFLGYNVKSAFVNATQIPLVTYPYLAAKYGDAKAVAELAKANSITIKSLTKIGAVDEDLAKMIETGLSESWLDESLATELAQAASEKNLDKSLPRHWTQKTWQHLSHYGALPFHTVEKFNRHLTAVATYRLARAEGRTHDQAVFDARKAVEKTQFEYARWARPRFMRGKVGGTVFVFMNYMQNALYFALGGDPGAFRMWLMLFALAGIQGLPFGEDIMDLVDGAMTFGKRKLGMKNPHTDVRTELRKTFKEMGADPDIIMHGLSSSTFGLANMGEFMGWPIPDMDLSASLSMGRIMPAASILRPANRDFDRFISEMTEGVGGAAVSGGLGLVKAMLDDANPNAWKRWEKAMPAAMRQVSKAARYAVKGEEATRSGYEIATLDWHDHAERMEVALQALGFTPREVSQGWEGYIAAQSVVKYYEVWKTNLLRDWNYSKMNGDDEAVKRYNVEIRAYNRIVPYPEMKIGPDTRRQSVENYYRTHAFNQRRIERSERSRRLSSEVLEVYKDAEDNR